jgi:hypothetical protein
MPVTINGSTGLTTNNGSVFTDASGNAGVGTSNPAVYGARLAVSGGNIIADFDRTIGFQWSGGLNQYFKGMSGVPQLAGGARGLHVFNYDNDASQGIRFWGGTFASKVEFGGFDSAGRMTTPLQPGFSAIATGSSSITPAAVIPINNKLFDVGNNFNTSTYTFTAPIAGKYLFSYSVRYNGYQANVYLHPGLQKNGATVAQSQGINSIASTVGDAYMSVTNTIIFDLAANDTVRLFDGSEGGTTGVYEGTQCHLTGYLLG